MTDDNWGSRGNKEIYKKDFGGVETGLVQRSMTHPTEDTYIVIQFPLDGWLTKFTGLININLSIILGQVWAVDILLVIKFN